MNAVYARTVDRRAMGVTAVLHVGAVAMFMNLEPMARIDGLPQALMVSLHTAEQVTAAEEPEITPPRSAPLARLQPPAPPLLAVPEPSPLPARVEAVSPKPAPEPTPVAREPSPEPVKAEKPAVAEPVSAPSAAPAPEPVKAVAPSMPAPVAIVPPRFDADYLHNPAPAYPPLSRRLREQGRVLLRVFVMPDGQPTDVEVRESSGFPRLDQAAQESVRRWRFVPARQGDKGVSAWVLVPISYSLRS
jgi:protein TonB